MKKTSTQQTLLDGLDEGNTPNVQRDRPPHLRRVVSVSLSGPVKPVFTGLASLGVTALLDTRLTPTYPGRYSAAGVFNSQADLQYLCECHPTIGYHYAEQLAPTSEARKAFFDSFKNPKLNASTRDPMAWTNFIQAYITQLSKTKPLKQGSVRDIIYGSHEAIAIGCACPNHYDCHRRVACAIFETYIPEIEIEIFYPGNEPQRASPRRYIETDFQYLGILSDTKRRSQ